MLEESKIIGLIKEINNIIKSILIIIMLLVVSLIILSIEIFSIS